MIVRRLDSETGDIVTSGKQFIYDREAVAQTIVTRIRLFLGEYFRDITDGTPWFQEILGKNESLSKVDAIIKNRIVRTEGVKKLLSYSADYDLNTRKYSIKAEILTIFGSIELNEEEGIFING